jgi:NTP pyrophosphatase (non-canonical NTP hydrolase)
MPKSLKQIQKDVEEFSIKRGWENNDPNQLITSILIELGELSEHYQWQNKFKKLNKREKKEIGYEFVDIIFYLARLANKSDIDLEEAFYDKLPKLEKKFPIGKDAKKAHIEYRKNGKNKRYE